MSGHPAAPGNKRKLNSDDGSSDKTDTGEVRRARIHLSDDHQVTHHGASTGSSSRANLLEEQSVNNLALAVDTLDERRFREDRLHLLSVLSEEVWEIVFEKLDDDPEVFENLSNASLSFRDMLLPKQMSFLFPKVAGILVKFYQKMPEKFGLQEPPTCIACGKRRRKLWCSDFLSLRLVCRDWAAVIDNLCQDSRRRFQIYESREHCFGDYWIKNYFYLLNALQTLEFTQHFALTHGTGQVERSPFLGREVVIQNIRIHKGRIARWDQLLSLFKVYGRHVWYCTFDSTETDIQHEMYFHVTLRDLVELMPNLKVLKVFAGYLQHGFLDAPKPRGLNKEKQFPTIPSLQFLEARDLPSVTLRALLCSNRHLHKLHVKTEKNPTDLDHFLYSEPMPNLQQVSLNCKLPLNGLKKLEENQNKIQVSLEKLSLEMETGNWEIQRIFNLLNSKWSETLTHLVLNFPTPDQANQNVKGAFSTAELNLAHISDLKLQMHAWHNLDFLLPLKDTLEFLEITVNCIHEDWKMSAGEEEAQQKIKFWSCSSPTLETNVWSLFPELKRIKYCEVKPVSWYKSEKLEWSHSRAEWAAHIKMKN